MAEDPRTEGWLALLDEMEALAAALETEGWEPLTIPAGDASAVTPAHGATDRHGYAYVIPGSAAQTFENWFEPERFPRTEIHRAVHAGQLFLLTVLFDPPTERTILLAGVLDRSSLGECRRLAHETGSMYSHVFRVDGTHLGSFEHDDPELFFSDE